MFYNLVLVLFLDLHFYTSVNTEFINCTASHFYDKDTDSCVNCASHTYSADGATECQNCDNDPIPQLCHCDTTDPQFYNTKNATELYKYPAVCYNDKGDNMVCTKQCYSITQQELAWKDSLSDYPFKDCNCNNAAPANVSRCEMFKNFTNVCFLNEDCRAYSKNHMDKCDISIEPCTKDCYNTIAEDTALQQCHCFNDDSPDSACSLSQDYFNKCIATHNKAPPKPNYTGMVVGVTLVSIMVIFLSIVAFLRFYSLKVGRKLKRDGDLGKILPYIVWNSMERLSSNTAAEQVIKFPFIRIAFPKIPFFKYEVFKHQHIVIKVFEESRLGLFKSEYKLMRSLDKAKKNNIITSYGINKILGDEDISEMHDTFSRFSLRDKMSGAILRNYTGPCTYMLLNHCNSKSLDKYPIQDAKQIKLLAYNIADALSYLNSKQVVHNDLKPHNILVKTKGKKKVTFVLGDFGMAQEYWPGDQFERQGGTLHYNPPEYLRKIPNAPSHQTSREYLLDVVRDPQKIDVYQYGLVLWVSLFQSKPNQGRRQYPYKAQLETLNNLINTEPQDGEIEEIRKLKQIQHDRDVFTKTCFKTLFVQDPQCRPSFDLDPCLIKKDTALFLSLKEFISGCWNADIGKRACARGLREHLDRHVYHSHNNIILYKKNDTTVYVNVKTNTP